MTAILAEVDMDRIFTFVLGPASIIVVLKIVSGDDHIHCAAPTVLLAIWFSLRLIWEKC